eukprot:CAMPEP_0172513862 /NCGR_PEP_ID=MMETSP1066-20121228/256073_1 /TAXON_ID=671091 /ORGANISM="Coscinodiscus wailesii, Strain CCMP2513" /LENGTH=781 /DNA_ID=CAMNT_0013294307 /DNA_START=656 /DNA_END=2998 /DNA_ORIENTATION=-
MSIHAPLEGDGLSFPLFHLLWTKSPRQLQQQQQQQQKKQNESSRTNTPPGVGMELRIPDTILLQFGQPLHWYFTSEKGKKATILRKRKHNLTIEKIEKGFLSSRRGVLRDDKDIVAYFISKGSESNPIFGNETYRSSDKNENENDDDSSSSSGGEAVASIEYFDERGLRDFLSHGRKERSGILQRFVTPSGTQNSLIRAIYTPKLTLLERRRNNKNLYDGRFGLYERAITFEGPDVLSSPAPLRGEVLAGKIQCLCDSVVRHIRDVSGNRRFGRIGRMVMNFKVDERDRVWLLWSSSIRMEATEYIKTPFPVNHAHLFNDEDIPKTQPLNIDPLIKVKPNVKLQQNANHNADDSNTNSVSFLKFVDCPSCGKKANQQMFHPVPYKTIIAHFDQVVLLMTSTNATQPTLEWPPDQIVINAAGGVGFGNVYASPDDNTPLQREDVVIPPILRQLHKRLKVPGFLRYKRDPLFLHKTCAVCENCFLAYAELASNSFQIAPPVRLDEGSRSKRAERDRRRKNDKKKRQTIDTTTPSERCRVSPLQTKEKSIGRVFADAPDLPPTVLGLIRREHSASASSSSYMEKLMQQRDDQFFQRQMTAIYSDTTDKTNDNTTHAATRSSVPAAAVEENNPLLHLVTAHMILEKNLTARIVPKSAAVGVGDTKTGRDKKARFETTNPYEEPLTFLDAAGGGRAIALKPTTKRPQKRFELVVRGGNGGTGVTKKYVLSGDYCVSDSKKIIGEHRNPDNDSDDDVERDDDDEKEEEGGEGVASSDVMEGSDERTQ